MNTRLIYRLVQFNLHLMHRESIILSVCIPVGVFCAATVWLGHRHFLPLDSALLWSAAAVYVAGQNVIVQSRTDMRDGIERLRVLPLPMTVIVSARQLTSAAVLLALVAITTVCLVSILRSPLVEIRNLLLFVGCSLPPLLIIGWAPIWPKHDDADAHIVGAILFAVSVFMVSLPYFIAVHIFHNAWYCLVWMTGFAAAWKYILLPKCAAWTLAQLLGNAVS